MSVNISYQVSADTVIVLVFNSHAALQLMINVCHSSTSIAVLRLFKCCGYCLSVARDSEGTTMNLIIELQIHSVQIRASL